MVSEAEMAEAKELLLEWLADERDKRVSELANRGAEFDDDSRTWQLDGRIFHEDAIAL
jgi:hypothetical protein